MLVAAAIERVRGRHILDEEGEGAPHTVVISQAKVHEEGEMLAGGAGEDAAAACFRH